MKGTNIGELEEIVLLVILNLQDDAYGVAIKKYIIANCNRQVSISTVHATLHRLEHKGLVYSKYDGSSGGERGGRPKLVFRITSSGETALRNIRELRNKLWDTVPSLSFSILDA